jgi:hypothetical protein
LMPPARFEGPGDARNEESGVEELALVSAGRRGGRGVSTTGGEADLTGDNELVA